MDFLQQLDSNAMIWIKENISYRVLDICMPIVSSLGDKGFIWIFLGVLILAVGGKYRRWGLIMLLSLALTAIVVNVILKPYVARIRPFDLLTLELLIEKPLDFSFPSGHTAAAFSAAVTALFINRKFGWVMLFVAFLMAFSRLYLLVHFPSDVIVGALIGATISFVTALVYKTKWN